MRIKALDSAARNAWLMRETGLLWTPEYAFCSTRRWRADHANETIRTLIEVDGGVWTGGRHSRGKGQEADNEKLNTAAVYGWFVLRYSTQQFASGIWIEEVLTLMKRFGSELRKAKGIE